MGRRIIAACGGSVRGKTIAILGLTFKPNTDDMREAPALAVVTALQDAGATVRGYDPEGMAQAKPLLPGITFAANAYDCVTGAHAVAILTEWDEFRALGHARAATGWSLRAASFKARGTVGGSRASPCNISPAAETSARLPTRSSACSS